MLGIWRYVWRIYEETNPYDEHTVQRGDERLSEKDFALAAKNVKRQARKAREKYFGSVHFCPDVDGSPPDDWLGCKDDPRAEYEEEKIV